MPGLAADDLLGVLAEVAFRAVEDAQDTQAARGSDEPEDLLADDGSLLRLQPLDEAVELGVPFVRDAHPSTIASRRSGSMDHNHWPGAPETYSAAAKEESWRQQG